MKLQEIASNLRDDAQSGPLNLTRSYFNLDSFGQLLGLLEVGQLRVETTPDEVTYSNGKVEVAGSSTLLSLPASLVLSLEAADNDQVDCSLSATLSGLTLASLVQNGFIPTTKLNPGIFLQEAFDDVALVAQSKTASLTLTVEGSPHSWSLLDDIGLNLSNIGFELTRSLQNVSGDPQVLLSILGEIAIGDTPLLVKLDLPTNPVSLPNQWGLSIGAQAPLSVALSDLSHFFMGVDAAGSLPPGLSQIGQFSLEKLEIEFDPVAKTVAMVSLTIGSSQPLSLIEKVIIEEAKVDLLVVTSRGSWMISTEVFGNIAFGSDSILAVRMMIPSASDDWYLSLAKPLNLSGIGDLIHIPGGIDLGDLNLPDSLSKNGTLWITRFELSFNPSQRTIPWIAFGIFLDADWTIFSDIGVGSPRIDLSIADPFDSSKRALTGSMSGIVTVANTTLQLTATKGGPGEAWRLQGQLAEDETVDLIKLIDSLLPGHAALPEEIQSMAVKNVVVTVDANGNSFSFSGQTSGPWRFTIGPKSVEFLASVQFESHLNTTTNLKESSGKLTGEIDIGSAKFQLNYQFDPAKKILQGNWADDSNHLGFESLASEFGVGLPSIDSAIKMPDLALKRVSFEIDFNKVAGDAFMLTAESASFGEAFFMLKKSAVGQWGFAFGVALPKDWKHLSQISGKLGDDLKVVDFIEFEAAFFMLATSEYKGFQVPGFPGLGRYPMQVQPGFTIGTVIDFGAGGSSGDDNAGAMSKLGSITRRDAMLLQVTVSDNPADMALVADLEGSVNITGAGGKKLTLSDAAVEIRIVPLAITLRGSVVFSVGGQALDATGRLTIGVTEANATFDLEAEDRYLPIPMGFKGVHLTEVGVAMGVIFEPPEVDVGLEGKFVIGEPPSPIPPYTPSQSSMTAMPQDDEFVFVFALAEEAINPVLLSMYMAEVSVSDLVVALLDQPVTLPDVVSDVKATELLLYWCDTPIMAPDGTWANPLFGFNANLDLWGFNAHASLMIDATSGFTGDACLDPVHIKGVLDLTGDGTGTPDTYKGSVTVKPGGPVIHVSTLTSPYLNVDWRLGLFNTISEAVKAEVTKNGFTFNIEYKLGQVFDSALSCSLENWTHFNMSFSIKLNVELGRFEILGGDVGKIYLSDEGFGAALDVNVTPEFVLTIDGDFFFEGNKRTMPQIRLAIAPSSLEDLPRLIIDQIKRQAEAIFQDIFDEATRLIQEGLDEARRLGVDAEQVTRILAGEGDQVVSEIKAEADRDARDIEHQAEQLAQDVYGGMQDVERAFTEAQQEIEDLAKRAEEEAERLANAAEQEAARLASGAATLARDAANKAKTIVNDVGNAVKEGAKDVWQSIKKY